MPNCQTAGGFAVLAASLFLGQATHAATFVYDLSVVTSQDATVDFEGGTFAYFDLPDIGTTGTVTISLDVDASNAATPIPDEFDAFRAPVMASAEFGRLTTSLESPFQTISPFAGGVSLRNGSFSSLFIATAATTAGGFSVSSATFGTAIPTTLGDVLAILSAGDAQVALSFSGTVEEDEVFPFVVTGSNNSIDFRAESTLAAVPLPAGGFLLLSAFGALALRRHFA